MANFQASLKNVHKLTEEDRKTQGEHVEVQNPDSTDPNPESIEMRKQGQKEAKPFHCQFCQKSFARKSQKINHERIRMGEKPFQCQFCHKYFARNYTKICNERIHTDDKPFRCGFSVLFNLVRKKSTMERVRLFIEEFLSDLFIGSLKFEGKTFFVS